MIESLLKAAVAFDGERNPAMRAVRRYGGRLLDDMVEFADGLFGFAGSAIGAAGFETDAGRAERERGRRTVTGSLGGMYETWIDPDGTRHIKAIQGD